MPSDSEQAHVDIELTTLDLMFIRLSALETFIRRVSGDMEGDIDALIESFTDKVIQERMKKLEEQTKAPEGAPALRLQEDAPPLLRFLAKARQ